MTKIAFDVDGTLIDDKDQPRHDILTMLRILSQYYDIIIWSGSGKDYAEMWSRRLFIDDIAEDVRVKPTKKDNTIDLAFDDEDVKLAKVNVKI